MLSLQELAGLLAESRLSDVIDKYGGIVPKSTIMRMSQEDPSGNNKYLDWMVKQADEFFAEHEEEYAFGGASPSLMNAYNDLENRVIGVVKRFHKNLPKIKNKDINSYKELRDLGAAVVDAEKHLSKKQKKIKIRKDATKVWEDREFIVIRPKTQEASCAYGAGTKWCISSEKDFPYFQQYTEEDGITFYFIINKKKDTSDKFYKVALLLDSAGKPGSFYDATDEQWQIRELPEVVGEERFEPILKAIKANWDAEQPVIASISSLAIVMEKYYKKKFSFIPKIDLFEMTTQSRDFSEEHAIRVIPQLNFVVSTLHLERIGKENWDKIKDQIQKVLIKHGYNSRIGKNILDDEEPSGIKWVSHFEEVFNPNKDLFDTDKVAAMQALREDIESWINDKVVAINRDLAKLYISVQNWNPKKEKLKEQIAEHLLRKLL